ncbi:hypothetical protein [Neptuniibacter marinus]|uniref:hypothetical protein n=1 Tax=Neptuniibacter marinus TaxID=1806670 RepID=UPI003B5A89AB
MGIFDLTPKKDLPEDCEPDWVTNGTEPVKKMYKTVLLRIEQIEELIASGKALETKERKIITEQISLQGGKGKTWIRKETQPDLYYLIKSENTRLKALSDRANETNRQKDTDKRKLGNLDRESILTVARNLRNKVTELENRLVELQVSDLYGSGLIQNKRETAVLVRDLRNENSQLQEEVLNLRDQLAQRDVELIDILTEHQELKREIGSLKSKKSLKITSIKG